MLKQNWLKKLCIAVGVTVVAAIAVLLYNVYAADTKIAFVNYPEYMLAPLLDQKINDSIQVSSITWTDQTGPELEDYDMIIFFGMGLNFSAGQQEILDNLTIPVYTTAATKSETALNSLTAAEAEQIKAYLNQGGKDNFRYMLDYIRYQVDGKRIFAPKPEAPVKVPHYAFFHAADDAQFETYGEYSSWYQKSTFFNPDGATVALFSGNGGGALAELITALEKRNLNVVGVNGMGSGVGLLAQIKPDLIIYQPHGRLSMQNPDATLEFLKTQNIPLLCPIKVSQEYEEYLHDQQGMNGGMLSQSITMPELDGGTVPFVLSALFRNERGLLEFRMIPERLERFAELVKKTTDLKRIPNADKKIAIIYYGSIGAEAATAGLGVSESIFNLLKRLQSAGYTTGELPDDVEALNEKLSKSTVEIRPDEFDGWVKKSMPADLYRSVVERYGEFPGKDYRTSEGNMAIGQIQFGNIIFMPQSLPGEGEDENKLIHGVKMAPPHTYIATYLYIRHGFKADAMMHFGTHGSLEFTPWKQVALSDYDWPDILVGEMPHYYLYIINNVGEAQIAKRRSYATMVSHLTPPFMQAGGYGVISQLHEKMENYETAENAMLKAEYGKTIVELAVQENYHKDLKLSDSFASGVITEDDFFRLHNFIHEIQNAKVNRGMYVLGRPYTSAEADETAVLMTMDTIAENLFNADLTAGKVTDAERRNLALFTEHYLNPAKARAAEALSNPQKYKPSAPPAMQANHGMTASADEIQKMMSSGKLPDGREIPPEMAAAMQQMGAMNNRPAKKVLPAKPVLSAEEITFQARQDLLDSTEAEMNAILNAFSGGYLYPSPGGDPILNPATVPTGKNLYGIDPERTPTKESFAVGKQLAEALIAEKLKSTGNYPKKVGFSLWGGEFIRTQGTNIGEIFYLLGVEPVWDSRGRVQDVRLIPLAELKRPRIDVLVQTSGQFRGAATSRMRLIDKAVQLAATDPDGEFGNYVREGSLEIVKALIANGMSVEQAKSLSNARLFGGVNGNFGTGITGMTQKSGSWDDVGEIAEVYLNNMGALYTEDHWGEHVDGVFKAAMQNTDTVVQSRSSNSWGPLSLDHVYEFTGGLSMAARHVTGKDPEAYFNDLRTPGQAKIQTAGEAAMVEARSTVLNPEYITEMMQEGAAATGSFVEVFQNTFGWEVMKPDMLEDHLWQEYKEVYVDDKLDLKLPEYFEENNPAALQEMTAIMLESVRKGYWPADAETIQKIAQTHTELMKKFDLPPVDNMKLREMIKQNLANPELQKFYEQQIEKSLARQKQAEEVSGQTLKEERLNSDTTDDGDPGKALLIVAGLILSGITIMVIGSRRRTRV